MTHWRQPRRGYIPPIFWLGGRQREYPPQYYYVLSDIADQYWLPSVRAASSRFQSAIRRHQFASVRQADSRLTGLVPPTLNSRWRHCDDEYLFIDVTDVMICSLQWVRYQAGFCAEIFILLSGKSTETAATKSLWLLLFDNNMKQIFCRLGLCPRPHWASLQRPQTPSCI